MNNAPTIVRLIRFPATLRLTRKGKQFIGPQRRSGPVILSERHDPIDCTFRVTAPGVTFTTGGTTITHTEAFGEGEQRDLLLPWGLIVDANARIPQLILEIDVSYSGTTELHTATVPLKLTYGMSSGQAAAVAGAAVAAVAIGAAVAKKRKRKAVVVDDDEDVELAVFNIASTKRAPAKASRKRPPKGSKVTVVDEDDAEVTVYNTGRRPAAAKKKAPAKKASTAKKKSPAKKPAGGTRRGSGASRPAPRKGGPGSSSARKSASRRTTRKSR